MIRLGVPADAVACLRIYRPAIENSIVSFEWTVPTEAEFLERFRTISKAYPWLVFEEGSEVVGYAYASSFRTRIAYQWSIETSVYVAPDRQGQGIGGKLYARLFEELKARGYVNAYAAISLPNDASVGFHEARGFRKIGHFEKTGFKNGQWIDVGFWSRLIQEPPANPTAPKR